MLGDIHSFNPDFLIILCDFNGTSNKWWVGDTQISEGCHHKIIHHKIDLKIIYPPLPLTYMRLL